jgi:hypothetical protein
MKDSRTLRLAFALVALSTLTAAKLVGERGMDFASGKGMFAVKLPSGWVHQSTARSVTVSRDGFLLNSISVSRTDLDDAFEDQMKEQRVEGDRKRPQIAADTPAEDLAAFYTAKVMRVSDQSTLVSDEPALLGGRPAFRVTTELKDGRGVRIRTTCTGTAQEQGYYEVCYAAPALHYYERDLAIYEALLASFEYLESNKKKRKR